MVISHLLFVFFYKRP